MNGVELAIERADGVVNLARIAQVTPSAVSQWRVKGVIPTPRRPEQPNRVAMIGEALGIPAHVLNPIVYRSSATDPNVKVA